tara:strand:- start:633 stop:1436 length:804 start_codon:yes stop_codon:yes gene_type:complete
MTLSLAIEIYFLIILIIFGFLFFANLFRLEKYLVAPLFNKSREFYLSILSYPILIVGLLVLLDIGTGAKLTSQLYAPVKFEKEKTKRYDAIKKKLLQIRDLQVIYKSNSPQNRFANSFTELIEFGKSDSITISKYVEKSEIIINPDWIANGWKESAIKKTKQTYITANGEEKVNTDEGWMKKSWFEKVELGKVKVCCSDEDSLQIKNIENLALVPFTNQKFNLAAKKLVKSNTEISVFEVSDPNPFDPTQALKIGDLNEVNLDGNWE